MNGSRYQDVVWKSNGVPASNAHVTVFLADGVTLASIYSDRALTTLIAGSVVSADTNGNYGFYARTGLYTLQFSGTGFDTFTDFVFLAHDDLNDRANVQAHFSAKGDGVTDDTAAIQAAVDSGLNVYFPTGRYVISSRIRIHQFGQRLIGENSLLTQIVQTSTTADAFFIDKSDFSHPELSLTGGAQLFNVIDGFEIEGPGAALTSGYGINASGDLSSHSGDYLVVRNCRIKGFARGLYFKGWGMARIENSISQLNGYGVYVDAGSSNSYTLDVNTNQNTVVGVYLAGGLGNRATLGDQGSQPRMIEVAVGQWQVDAVNMESYTGPDAVYVHSNASLILIGAYFNQLAGAQTTIPIQVESNAAAFLIGCRKAGYVNGTPIANKIGDSAVIRGLQDMPAVADTGVHLLQNGANIYRIQPWDNRNLSGAPAASSDLLNSMYFVKGVHSVSSDQWRIYYEDATGTAQFKDLLEVGFHTGDTTLNDNLNSGATATQITNQNFQDQGVTKWAIQKDASNTWRFVDSAASGLNRWTVVTGGAMTFNTGGSGAINFNTNANSGTGGYNFGSGGASPTTVASISAAGKGTFNGGLVVNNVAAPTVAANQLGLGSTTATTVGAAGAASALPANPVGYLVVNIGGTNFKIPYYNV